jgi:NAD(P)-dependent dehydrogenase (short-subunit alcohol dehydrogenase family)
MNRVEGKVAIVTGGSHGIGKSTCEVLAKEGARVAITDVKDSDGKNVAKDIQSSGGTAEYWHLDVSQESEVKAVFQQVKEKWGKLDVLVNNAGITGPDQRTHEIEADDWRSLLSINVDGVFYCTKHGVRAMLENGGGSIINLSSIYGIVGAPDIPAYHASKGAVRLMSKTDALLYAKDNIRVNSVHPGFIWTPLVENYLKQQGDVEEGRKNLDQLHPIGHVGKPEDIAYGILYLASDESKFTTGSELVIDGGYTAR